MGTCRQRGLLEVAWIVDTPLRHGKVNMAWWATLDIGNGSSETMYDEGDGKLAVG